MSSPARGTLCSVQSLWPALAVCFSFNPFTNIGRTVFELNSIGFATRQKLYGVTIQERYVLQVQSQQLTRDFQTEESLQFRDVLGLDSAAERKNNFVICGSLDLQHTHPPSPYLGNRDSNPDTNIKTLKNKELRNPRGSSFTNSRFFREYKTDLSGVSCRASGGFETKLVDLERADL
jgi:hypothetical protein